MRGDKAQQWIEGYLYSARGHRALEQSVFAEGERHGFSERKLCKARQAMGIGITAGCWELSAVRAAALDARSVLETGEPVEAPVKRRGLPAVGVIDADTPLRVRRAA